MQSATTGRQARHRSGIGAATLLLIVPLGCASPGPPRPPSLHLPEPVKTLDISRAGDRVSLALSVPQRSTDDLPLHDRTLGLKICRSVGNSPCLPMPNVPASVPTQNAAGQPTQLHLAEQLPSDLASGAPRLLAYRAEFFNSLGRSAGPSTSAYILAGHAPAAVLDLAATGSRLGTVLSWAAAPPDGGRIVLRREQIAPPAAKGRKSAVVFFHASQPPEPPALTHTLDTGAQDGVTYRYTAWRELSADLGGRHLTLRSAYSAPVEFTLHDVFPPPAPIGLTAAPYTEPPAANSAAPGTYAVDLIWQPVEDPGLAGYNLYREPLGADGAPTGPRVKLNPTLLAKPAFHDATAEAGQGYRWSVTALDRKGNESAAATTEIQPPQQ